MLILPLKGAKSGVEKELVVEPVTSCPSTNTHLLPCLPWVRDDGHCEKLGAYRTKKASLSQAHRRSLLSRAFC